MSKWDKLLNRIPTLSNDVSFDELKKSWRVTAIQCASQAEEAAIIPSEKRAVLR